MKSMLVAARRRVGVAGDQVDPAHRLGTDVVDAAGRVQRGEHGGPEVVGVHDVRPAVGRSRGRSAWPCCTARSWKRVIGSSPTMVPKPEHDAGAGAAGVVLHVRLPDRGRLGGAGDLDRRVLADPGVALVGVEERHALLHDPAHPGLAGGLDHPADALGAEPVVGAPGVRRGPRTGRPARGWRSCRRRRRPRTSRPARRGRPGWCGAAPRRASAAAAAFSGVRASPTTSWPAATSAGTADRPMTPVAPMTATLTR